MVKMIVVTILMRMCTSVVSILVINNIFLKLFLYFIPLDLEYNKDDYCSWPDYFLCHNKICINANLTCNGINDCGDFSDERQCSK